MEGMDTAIANMDSLEMILLGAAVGVVLLFALLIQSMRNSARAARARALSGSDTDDAAMTLSNAASALLTCSRALSGHGVPGRARDFAVDHP